jgi:hypothetical protein
MLALEVTERRRAMRGFKRSPWLTGLGVLLTILGVAAGRALAVATIDKPASLLVYPKLKSDEHTDTLVQLTNTYTTGIFVHCTYITRDDGVCSPHDFTVGLTAQQPTFWRLSTGRYRTTPDVAPPCTIDDYTHQRPCGCQFVDDNPATFACPEMPDGGGNNPLPIGNFDGAMYCYEVMSDGSPVARNAIKGEAIIENLDTGDISAYNAVGLLGTEVPNPTQLDLDNEHFNSCPNWLVLNSYSEGYPEEAFGSPPWVNASVTTELSLVPCTIDLGTAQGPSVAVQLDVYNEYEAKVSTQITVSCFFRENLSDIATIFNFWNFQETPTLATRIIGSGLENGGVLGMAMETHTVAVPDDGGWPAKVTAAYNLFEVYREPFRVDSVGLLDFGQLEPGDNS